MERIDPSLPVELRNALKNFSFPEFEPVVNGFRAISDSAWKLPTPIEGIGYRTFYFVDENPDGEEVRSGTITSGTLKVTVASSDAGCAQVGDDGVIVGEVVPRRDLHRALARGRTRSHVRCDLPRAVGQRGHGSHRGRPRFDGRGERTTRQREPPGRI